MEALAAAGIPIPQGPALVVAAAAVLAASILIALLSRLAGGGGHRRTAESSRPVAVLNCIGTNVPEHKARPDYFLKVCDGMNYTPEVRERVGKIIMGSGIEARGSVCAGGRPEEFMPMLDATEGARGRIWEEHAPRMALAAARAALAAWSRGSAQDITHVVVHSCTGFSAPGLDFHLIQALGLPRHTRKVGVNYMGCFGAFSGMFVAKQIVEADPTNTAAVLVVCAEVCSVHVSREPRVELIVGNTLFADGGAAVIVTNSAFASGHPLPPDARPRVEPFSTSVDLTCAGDGTSSSLPTGWAVGAMSSDIVPDSAGHMTWRQSADGGRYDMFLDRSIPKALASTFATQGSAMMRRVGLYNPWTTAWAIHPGGKAILDVFRASLQTIKSDAEGLDASYDVLRNNGNMSSPTILFVLSKVLASTKRNNVFFAGFGPGLTIEYGRLSRVQLGGNGAAAGVAVSEDTAALAARTEAAFAEMASAAAAAPVAAAAGRGAAAMPAASPSKTLAPSGEPSTASSKAAIAGQGAKVASAAAVAAALPSGGRGGSASGGSGSSSDVEGGGSKRGNAGGATSSTSTNTTTASPRRGVKQRA